MPLKMKLKFNNFMILFQKMINFLAHAIIASRDLNLKFLRFVEVALKICTLVQQGNVFIDEFDCYSIDCCLNCNMLLFCERLVVKLLYAFRKHLEERYR